MKATSPGLGKRGPWRWPLDLMCLVCPVPNTYVGMRSCILTMILWWCGGSATSYPDDVLGSTLQTWLSGLACSHVLHLTLSGAPKILLYCTKYRRPTTLSPMNEASWDQWGKNLIGKKITLYWVKWSVRVVSLDTNNRKHKSLKRVETCQKKYFTFWLFCYVNSFFRFILPNGVHSLDIYIYISV